MAQYTLTKKILLALLGGFIFGAICNHLIMAEVGVNFLQTWLIDGLFQVVGQLFISSLKMLVVPLIFVSLVCGVANLDDVKKIGRIGGKTFAFYLFTTFLAISLAISLALIFSPGQGFNLPTDVSPLDTKTSPGTVEVLGNLIPSNPVQAAAQGQMLQVIIFALIFGLGVSLVDSKNKTREIFNDLNDVVLKIITLLMYVAPYGVFALITRVFAQQGMQAIRPLFAYFFLVVVALILQSLIVYSGLLYTLTKINPLHFFQKMRATIMFAFSTSSSSATLPMTMRTATQDLKLPKSIASFTLPLGATINMDGTAIMQGVATIFIAQAYNIELPLSSIILVILTATAASIGTAGVPGVGLITLAMVLRQANLPVEGIALIMGVDRLLDMLRTAVNVTGDTVVACIVSQSETGKHEPKVADS